MPFTAIAIAGLGATIGTALHNKKEQKKQDALQKQAVESQQNLLKTLEPYGTQFLGQGRQNMDIVQNYLRSLASGNRALTMETLAPEINAMTQQQQGSVAAARSLYPRGGTTAAAAAQLPWQLQGNVNNMIMGARPQAMQQLGQLGGNQASLGLGALGQGAGLTNSMLNYGLQAREQMFNQGSALGSGAVNAMMMAYMMRPQSNPTMPAGLPTKSVNANFTPGPSESSSWNPWVGDKPNYNVYSPNSNPYSGGNK